MKRFWCFLVWIPPLDNEQDKRTLLGIVKPFEANKGRMCLFVIRLSHASRLAVVFVVSIVSIPFRLVFRLNVLPHYIDGFLSLNILGETLKGLPLKIEIATPPIPMPHRGRKRLKRGLKRFLLDCQIVGLLLW